MPDVTQGQGLVKKRRSSNFTDGQITEALTVLALCSGNKRKASERTGISCSTLAQWKSKQYPDEYKRIVEKELPRVYGEIAERCEDLALTESAIEEELALKLQAEMHEMKPSDVSTALRNMAVAKAVNIDKASLVRGRPTAITERRDASELLRSLANRFGGMVKVDAEAEVIEE